MSPAPLLPGATFRTPPTDLHPRGLPAPTTTPSPSGIDPTTINNGVVLGVFALIFCLLIIATIWFFAFAPNGGWKRIEREDWEDYKSTVLRRKGPDGKTLTNATPSTKLGITTVKGGWSEKGSVVGGKGKGNKQLKREMRQNAEKGGYEGEGDADVRRYREEEAATVGGINKPADGSYYDSQTDRSAMFTASIVPDRDVVGNKLSSPHGTPTKGTPKSGVKAKTKGRGGFFGLRGGGGDSSHGLHTIPSTDDSAVKDFAYSANTYSNSTPTSSPTKPRGLERSNAAKRASASHTRQRPSQHRPRNSQSHQQPHRSGHRLSQHVMNEAGPHPYTPTASDLSSYLDGSNRSSHVSATNSEAGLTANSAQIAGTKVYRHPIPGLSVGGSQGYDSVLESGLGAKKNAGRGYRRGAAGGAGVRKVTNEQTGRRTAGMRRDSLDSD